MKLKHYLFPSEHNDYRPWIITPTALVIFCLIIWSLRLIIPSTIAVAASSIDAYDLMNKINNERTQRFIPALNTNQKLITASDGKARDMLARSYFAHVDPDGNYVWPRIEAAGYTPYQTLGENLAMDFTTADGVINGWMNSPTHRANVLNDKFEDQGLTALSGTYEPQHDTIMVVSLFGTLYKTKTVTQAPSTPPTPAKPATKPSPAPTPAPSPSVSANKTPPQPAVEIFPDIKISTTTTAAQTFINLDVVINGSPTLATARLKSQSITLKSGKSSGQFLGQFIFNKTEDLSNQIVTVEARDAAGTKISQEFPINIPPPSSTAPVTPVIPVSNEASIIRTLRIVFAVFAGIYIFFLIIDSIIIHRNKVKRNGIHSNPHILVLLLIVAISIFANWI